MDSNMASFLYCCGTMYSKRGNYFMARYTFQIASRFKHAPSIRELGILHVKGQGGNVDIYEGSRLLHLAEYYGDETASIALDSYLEI
jgi:hypothetical protein